MTWHDCMTGLDTTSLDRTGQDTTGHLYSDNLNSRRETPNFEKDSNWDTKLKCRTESTIHGQIRQALRIFTSLVIWEHPKLMRPNKSTFQEFWRTTIQMPLGWYQTRNLIWTYINKLSMWWYLASKQLEKWNIDGVKTRRTICNTTKINLEVT